MNCLVMISSLIVELYKHINRYDRNSRRFYNSSFHGWHRLNKGKAYIIRPTYKLKAFDNNSLKLKFEKEHG